MNGITEAKTSTPRSVGQARPETASKRVVVKLWEMIQRGELRPGDRLPPQRDLAKLFGVSRPSLSAGIGSLVAVGILHSRQGAGTFVAETEESPAHDNGSLRLIAALHGSTSDEMLEAQWALEMTIAGLAAERATIEQMVSLAEEVAAMYASLDDPEQYSIHDAHFHQLMAAASGNRILSALMHMLPAILSDVRREMVKHAVDLRASAAMHLQIYRAIRGRNPEAARIVMYNHLKLTQGLEEKRDA